MTTVPETGGMRPLSARGELLERDAELRAVDALIGAAGDSGQLLVIEGPPGIGKTSLIAEAKARGQGAGMLALGARGSELERTFPYGVVRQLFEPLLAQLPKDERSEPLAGAAALAAPLFDPAHLGAEPGGDGSLAALHGLYWLTANLAARRPLLIVVDDLHWCDLPSLRWLGYLLPRLEELPVLLVLSLRPAEPGENPALVGRIASDPLAVLLRPAPLGREAASRLVRATMGPEAEEAFCFACHEKAGGNPFLLRALLNEAGAEGLAPTAANVPRLRHVEARAGSRALALRLARLPPEAMRLARAVAILGDDGDPRHAAALADLDERTASELAVALARVDVLRAHAPLGFVHPLIRAAVYEALAPDERGAGHARAARLLAEHQAEPERVAAHLLVAPPAADAGVVAVLREAARRASSRGAPESASACLRRALAEPPAASERADLLLELGAVEALVSGEDAVEHLQEAYDLLDEPTPRAEAALLLGDQLARLSPHESVGVFRHELEQLGGADAELERLLEAGLIRIALSDPWLYNEATRRLERVRRGSSGDATIGEKMLLAELAFHDARAGAPAAVAVPLARRALAGGTLLGCEVSAEPFVLACIVLVMADLDEPLRLYDAALAEAHQRGSILDFAIAKVYRAHAFVSRGDLAEAEAEGREALDACEAWGTSARFETVLAAFVSEALMEQGKLEDAADALARADLQHAPPDKARLFLNSRGRFRMLEGDLAGGLEDALEAGRRFEAVGGRNPAFTAWRSQAALALLQLGEREEAGRLASEELELAHSWGAPRALGAALRVRGLVEGGEEGIALLEEAVAVLTDSPAKLEHAKALTELGAALRRANHRKRAGERLRRALELATICGAAPLAARAETELLATGARPRRIALSGVESLTPSERRVAQLAAQGPTNREIAQALVVTLSTVEVHLTNAYRKLGISSRSQLRAALAGPDQRSGSSTSPARGLIAGAP